MFMCLCCAYGISNIWGYVDLGMERPKYDAWHLVLSLVVLQLGLLVKLMLDWQLESSREPLLCPPTAITNVVATPCLPYMGAGSELESTCLCSESSSQ